MRLQVLVSPYEIAVFQYDCVHIPTEGQGDALIRVIDSYPCVFPELLRCSVEFCDKAMSTIVYEVADEVESSVAKCVYFVQFGMYHFYLVLEAPLNLLDAVYGIFDITGDFLWCSGVRICYYQGMGCLREQGDITFPEWFVIEFVTEEAEDIFRGTFDDWDKVVEVVFVWVEAEAGAIRVAISVGNHGEVVFVSAQCFELCFVHGFSPLMVHHALQTAQERGQSTNTPSWQISTMFLSFLYMGFVYVCMDNIDNYCQVVKGFSCLFGRMLSLGVHPWQGI